MEWTGDDRKWIIQIGSMFNDMFGEDFLKYCTDDSKCCIVEEASIPEKYRQLFNQGTTEPKFKTGSTPEFIHPSTTTEKISDEKGKNERKVKRELVFSIPKAQTLRLPRVCPWGGLYKCGSLRIKLVNTCPIDNFLTLFSLNIEENSFLWRELENSPYASTLLQVISLYKKNKFPEAKIRWLEQMPSKFNVSTSGELDVWGNEQELFLRCISEAFEATCTTICSSPHCPRKQRIITTKYVNLQEVTVIHLNEEYLQASLREWLHTGPAQCGERFKGQPPTGADFVMGPKEICLSTNRTIQIPVCNGVRTLSERKFTHSIPFSLPIYLGQFAAKGIITEIANLPSSLYVGTTEYNLVGSTLFGNSHYNACVKVCNTWGHYDGLRENKHKGSGLLMGSDLTKRNDGFSLSTCLYIKKT